MSREVSAIMQRARGRAELALDEIAERRGPPEHDHAPASPCGGCADRDARIAALEQRLHEVDEVAAANWLELVDLRERLRGRSRST